MNNLKNILKDSFSLFFIFLIVGCGYFLLKDEAYKIYDVIFIRIIAYTLLVVCKTFVGRNGRFKD